MLKRSMSGYGSQVGLAATNRTMAHAVMCANLPSEDWLRARDYLAGSKSARTCVSRLSTQSFVRSGHLRPGAALFRSLSTPKNGKFSETFSRRCTLRLREKSVSHIEIWTSS